MKRSDLLVGQHYAVSRNREGSFAQERVLDSLKLYMQTHRHRYGGKSEGIVPVPSDAKDLRPTKGDTYPYREVGLLMHDPQTPGKQILVQPAHVKMTWEDYQIWVAETKSNQEAATQRRLQAEALRKEQAAEILAELERIGLWFHVSDWEDYQKVPNNLLLGLLRKV